MRQKVKRSAHNVMYILLLYTRTAVVLVVDSHNELPGSGTLNYASAEPV